MLIKWNVTIPALSGNTPRRAFVWLPDSYDENPEKRYPVLYLFDGHNIFRDEYAAFGKSWGMEAYMAQTGKELIIVAVECNHQGNQRLSEYTPFSYRNKSHGTVPGRGTQMMRWMAESLKPYVDARFRTLPQREHTIIGGSSMGGLIALYGVLGYNSVYGKALCLSPSLWVSPGKVLAMIARADIAPDTLICMNYGEAEMGNHRENPFILSSTAALLVKKKVNLAFRIVPGAGHCEAAWEQQIPSAMDCLGL